MIVIRFRVITLGDHTLSLQVKTMRTNTTHEFQKRIYTQALRLQAQEEAWGAEGGGARQQGSPGLRPRVLKRPKALLCSLDGESGHTCIDPMVKIHCVWWHRPSQSFPHKTQKLLCLSKATMWMVTPQFTISSLSFAFWELFKVYTCHWHKWGRALGLENFSLKTGTK